MVQIAQTSGSWVPVSCAKCKIAFPNQGFCTCGFYNATFGLESNALAHYQGAPSNTYGPMQIDGHLNVLPNPNFLRSRCVTCGEFWSVPAGQVCVLPCCAQNLSPLGRSPRPGRIAPIPPIYQPQTPECSECMGLLPSHHPTCKARPRPAAGKPIVEQYEELRLGAEAKGLKLW